ncbi:MAG TPA: PQQ-dependent sugar dehydrogenase [Caulobacteraceae bacterium]|nr:PQQ-dependent sugar dehydrogenase [Caulobacteraceae bacterium]
MVRCLPALAAVSLTVALSAASRAQDYKDGPPAEGQHPAFPGQTRAPAPTDPIPYHLVTVATGLNHPWSIAWLPDERMLVTERPGRVRIIAKDGTLSAPLSGVPTVAVESQGGLMDLALDPAFAANHLIYLSYLEPRGEGLDGISIGRARLVEDGAGARLDGFTQLLKAEPAAKDGVNVASRLAFGRDGKLYITLGDRMVLREQAQSLQSDVGKVARVNPDGSIPRDNPFVGHPDAQPEIFTYGHRNSEGLTINPATGAIWELEHGPKGGDEINVLHPGRNYGWPVITYGIDYSGAKVGIGTQKAGMEQPIYYWDPSIAPSGMTFYTGELFPAWKGNLFVGALKAERVVRLVLKGEHVVAEENLLLELHERIRDVRQGPDGALYILTDADAGRVLKLMP